MKIKCPACNFENEENTNFCSSCGKSFSEHKNSKVISHQREIEIKEEEKIREKTRKDLQKEDEAKGGCGQVFAFLIALIITISILILTHRN